ncbi:MAG: tRNA uridine-5-carboxymethylaminomethyl(34) synthesis GTPase MnmE [candidate division FCPU426 bacterium]
MRSDTIAAICTPPGRGGIGIIRISGPKSLDIVNNVISTPYNLSSLNQLNTRKLLHSSIYNEKREKIDEVLLALMPRGKSYTGELTVEIHCHGGRAVIKLIMDMIITNGARIANPGEFTRRAFENGRITLIQAEAIDELIKARTTENILSIWKKYDEGFNGMCIKLKKELEKSVANIYADVEFSIVENGISYIKEILLSSVNTINNIISKCKNKKDGEYISISLIGPANSGKSSLFNKILKIERSIVSEVPGTTRDYISEIVEIDGREVKITDTAGFKDMRDNIDIVSISNTIKQKQKSDIIIFVLDQNKDVTDYMNDINDIISSRGIIVLNKCDLFPDESLSKLSNYKDIVYTSSINNKGIEELLNILAERINSEYRDDCININHRQTMLLNDAVIEIKNALNIINYENSKFDMILFHINVAIIKLSEIIGEVNNDEILNDIFSNFCIGK